MDSVKFHKMIQIKQGFDSYDHKIMYLCLIRHFLILLKMYFQNIKFMLEKVNDALK